MSKKNKFLFTYKLTQVLSGIVAKVVFKRKFIRNELKGKKGPIVIVGNHQAALDFTSLIGATNEHISYVVSDSFYNTLPLKKPLDTIGVIPKQQFQTSIKEVAQMRSVIKKGGILMMYPAGLMCEDGLPTPIPRATYEFLKWLGADVYAARTSGTYFCTPKWSGKIRPGTTYLDIYKLIDKDDLANMSPEQIKNAVDGALDFDAYREQEKHMVKYLSADNVEGLENVLYICPNCKKEFSIHTKSKNTLYCTECGFAHTSDKYGFLHNSGSIGDEIRYVSDWSRFVNARVREDIESGRLTSLSSYATVQTIDHEKRKFVDIGRAKITLTQDSFIIDGTLNGEEQILEIPHLSFASIPFSPGKRIEIQNNKVTYRCILDDGKLAQKFVNMVKVFYELNEER